ncbi:MAG: hypothetical protein HYZ48_01790 [Chlamydiales bacterium]|nr:hypothetical protein [Chlamydiales bacterium]
MESTPPTSYTPPSYDPSQYSTGAQMSVIRSNTSYIQDSDKAQNQSEQQINNAINDSDPEVPVLLSSSSS